MISRRPLIAALAAPGALPWRALAQAADPADFVKRCGNEFSDLLVGADSTTEKKRRLQPFLDRVVDVDGVGRFCLGRYWRQASAGQQQQYLQLFHAVLLNAVVGRVGDYRNERTEVVVNKADARDDGSYVMTVVKRPGNPPANVTWVVNTTGGRQKISDLIVEGTSLRVTMRNDYASFLSRNNDRIDALLDALRRQAEN